MSHRYTIKIPDQAKSQWWNLLTLLQEVLPIEFAASGKEIAGEILVSQGAIAESRQQGSSSFSLPDSGTVSSDHLSSLEVKFADQKEVPFPFRGRVLRAEVPVGTQALVLMTNEHALASSTAGPVWSFSQKEGVNHYRSAFPLPLPLPNGNLADVLNGGRFLEILPFLHWLREVSAPESLQGPAPRACFIFDDPNLHWPTYGFVDYQEVASHAQKENYHVSFATIPLDGWLAHPPTVEIFRQNRSRLSLSVHGNNHTKGELGRAYSEAERSFLLQEAIQRIEHLERRTGLSVSRVMIPPHGACSEQMLAALPTRGFEAACISHGSLRHHNKSSEWSNTLGFRPSEWIQGCPVLPRWGFSGSIQNTILLAAYLKQAIILRGHHQDLRNGLELLDESARFINGLGSVQWLNMTDMVRSSYQWRALGDLWQVKPLSRKIFCSIPQDLTKLQLDPSGRSSEAWEIVGPNGRIPNPIQAVSVQGGQSFLIESPPIQSSRMKTRLMPSTSLWFIRRLLTEGRDRLQPTLR